MSDIHNSTIDDFFKEFNADRAADLAGRVGELAIILAELEAENERLRDCRGWFFYPIEVPLTADGNRPATVGVDATSISYEVWDRRLNSYSAHDNLPDAINDAMARCAALKPTESDQ